MILTHFLREDMLPENARPQLRKSLAFLDEPEASVEHFKFLVKELTNSASSGDKKNITAIRQLNICLWILFAWARDAGNLESAYLSAEYTMLQAWEIAKTSFTKKTKAAKSIQDGIGSILNIYQQIRNHYLEKIVPCTDKQDGLSFAVRSSSHVDVNLKLFDILGRLAISGLWSVWGAQIHEKNKEIEDQLNEEISIISYAIKSLISNNPTLFLPLKDDHAIDVFLVLLFLSFDDANKTDMMKWLLEIVERAIFAFKSHGPYPCTLRNYHDLLDHPRQGDEEYRIEVTEGSILYPTIALWAALLEDDLLFKKIKSAKKKYFDHCNFQLWYPDETTEEFLYTNQDLHGAVVSNVPVHKTPKEMLKILWKECDENDQFTKLSAWKSGFWPLVLIASRHYRIPVAVNLTMHYRNDDQNSEPQVDIDV